ANPLYVRADAQFRHIKNQRDRELAVNAWKQYRTQLAKAEIYDTLYEKRDLYLPFLERAYQLLRQGGQLALIVSDAYNAAKYSQKSHTFFLTKARVQRLDFCSDIDLFDAGVNNTILHFAKEAATAHDTPLRVRRWGESREQF